MDRCLYSQDYSYIIASFKDNLAIAVIDPDTGLLLKAFYFQDLSFIGLIVQVLVALEMDSSSNIYGLLYDDTSAIFYIFKFDPILSSSSTALINLQYSEAYVYGFVVFCKQVSTNFQSQSMITAFSDPNGMLISKFSLTDGVMNYYVQTNFPSSSNYYVSNLDSFKMSNGLNSIFGCVSLLGASESDLGFFFLKESASNLADIEKSWYLSNPFSSSSDCLGSLFDSASTTTQLKSILYCSAFMSQASFTMSLNLMQIQGSSDSSQNFPLPLFIDPSLTSDTSAHDIAESDIASYSCTQSQDPILIQTISNNDYNYNYYYHYHYYYDNFYNNFINYNTSSSFNNYNNYYNNYYNSYSKNITVFAGQQKLYSLPQAKDDQNDQISLKLNRIRSGVEMTIPSFVKFNNEKQVTISPKDNSQLGIYQMQVTISDNQLKSIYYFFIVILKNNLNENSQDKELSAFVKKISLEGEVEIKFSKPIYTPVNYTSFNNTQIKIEILDGSQVDKLRYSIDFDWKVVKILDQAMIIQLIFYQGTEQISVFQDRDILKITFIENGNFIAKMSSKCIEYKYQMKKELPPLLNPQDFDYEALREAVEAAQKVLKYMIAALDRLWGITNVLQLYFMTPLLTISTPANIIFVYRILVDAVSFDFINLNDHYQQIFQLQDDYGSYSLNFEYLGYDQRNFIYSMGPLFVFMIIAIVSTIIMIVLWTILKRIQILCLCVTQKIQNKQRKEVKAFYTIIFRWNLNEKQIFKDSIYTNISIKETSIQSLIIINLLYLCYIVSIRPFKQPQSNNMEILNETSYFCISSYALPILTDFSNDQALKNQTGILILSLIAMIIVINLSVIIHDTFQQLKRKYNKFVSKNRLKLRRFVYEVTKNADEDMTGSNFNKGHLYNEATKHPLNSIKDSMFQNQPKTSHKKIVISVDQVTEGNNQYHDQNQIQSQGSSSHRSHNIQTQRDFEVYSHHSSHVEHELNPNNQSFHSNNHLVTQRSNYSHNSYQSQQNHTINKEYDDMHRMSMQVIQNSSKHESNTLQVTNLNYLIVNDEIKSKNNNIHNYYSPQLPKRESPIKSRVVSNAFNNYLNESQNIEHLNSSNRNLMLDDSQDFDMKQFRSQSNNFVKNQVDQSVNSRRHNLFNFFGKKPDVSLINPEQKLK
ncbi:UNKNOWN [Stylonychia lemnae]|uniref:Cadg domain containing protein n=1 Tax=Stylonychia lemnae TaxID=5949 RepID=A0A078AUT5_STYLE|nr:UNKNOWN [Stylonychia lemnae]|eukprot:CDW84638.1 UNKNOWN [Stylonychia lemnae]